MRRSIACAAAAVVLAATLVACGGSSGNSVKAGPTNSSESSGSPTTDNERTPDTSPSSTQPKVAKLGDTLSLVGEAGLGYTGTVTADVTLNKYEDHAEPSVGFFKAPAGQRLVAAQFTIVSTGQALYDDIRELAPKVIDSTGEVHVAKPGSPTVGASFDLSAGLQPGEKTTGWVIFNVPEDAKITGVTYQMDSILQKGKDETVGKWTL